MGPITDSDGAAAHRDALQNWRYAGYVWFDLNETAAKWLRTNLGISDKDLSRLMYEYVVDGGEVDEVVETREPCSSRYEFHHALRFRIGNQPVYVETRLQYKAPFKPDTATITVVNIHAP